jgi:hypothetical protein
MLRECKNSAKIAPVPKHKACATAWIKDRGKGRTRPAVPRTPLRRTAAGKPRQAMPAVSIDRLPLLPFSLAHKVPVPYHEDLRTLHKIPENIHQPFAYASLRQQRAASGNLREIIRNKSSGCSSQVISAPVNPFRCFRRLQGSVPVISHTGERGNRSSPRSPKRQ